MKKSIAIILLVCLLTFGLTSIGLANSVIPPVHKTTSHHTSFWVHSGKYVVGTALVWWIVDSISHKDKAKPVTTEWKQDVVVITPIP